MSLTFNGTTGVVVLDIGTSTALDFGPVTVAACVKRLSNGGGGLGATILAAETSGGAINSYSYLLDSAGSGEFEFDDTSSQFAHTTGPGVLVADDWCMIGYNKATGSATARFHHYKFSTTTITHSDGHQAAGDATAVGAGGKFKIGNYTGAVEPFNGDIAWVAIWDTALTDANFVTMETGLTAVYSLTPTHLWVMTTTGVIDVMGNGSNEISRTGTTAGSTPPAGHEKLLSNPVALTTLTDGTATGTVYTTSSVSPVSDCLLIAVFGTDPNIVPWFQLPTITTGLSNVGTWTFYEQDSSGSDQGMLCIAVAKVTGAPGSGTITFTFANERDNFFTAIYYVIGHSTTTPVRQSAGNYAAASTSSSATFGSTPTATSLVLVACYHFVTANAADPVTPRAGYTELHDLFSRNTTYGFGDQLETQYLNGSATTTISGTGWSDNTYWLILGVEINQAADAPGTPTIVRAVPEANAASLVWNIPIDGGSAITDYLIEYNPASAGWSTFTHTASTNAYAFVTGLTAGVSYTFRISAINTIGTGTASAASEAAVPLPTHTIAHIFYPLQGDTMGRASASAIGDRADFRQISRYLWAGQALTEGTAWSTNAANIDDDFLWGPPFLLASPTMVMQAINRSAVK